MKADIIKRVEKDLNGDAEEAIKILTSFEKTHNFGSRVTRCIVVLSKGDLVELRKWIEESKLDWRDVIVDAEEEPLQYRTPFTD